MTPRDDDASDAFARAGGIATLVQPSAVGLTDLWNRVVRWGTINAAAAAAAAAARVHCWKKVVQMLTLPTGSRCYIRCLPTCFNRVWVAVALFIAVALF